MERLVFFVCTLAALGFYPFAALAFESRIVSDSSGKAIFQVNFFDKGENYGSAQLETENSVSTWQLNSHQKNAMVTAIQIWAEILGPGANNSLPAVISVGTFDDDNAEAISSPNPAWEGGPWEGFAGLAGALIGNQAMGCPAEVHIGTLNFYIPQRPSSLPTESGVDMVAAFSHEMGHALGLVSSADRKEDSPQGFFGSSLSPWDKHLYDKYGNQPAAGMEIVLAAEDPSNDPTDVFVAGEGAQSGVSFKGEHVSEVLGGALGNKLPINGLEIDNDGIIYELSHIELARSLMSHQTYRNYTTLMEVEMAVLQDIGYAIDRRNVYGFSVYGDGQTLTNHNGFFARNAAGNASLPGAVNTAAYGLGLHIYGSNNDVSQAADLLAGGTGGTGIRVDGSANTLRIAPGVRVQADGAYGTGLLVAYGKEHTVVSAGNIQAMGQGGIAARFDFGHNLMGDDGEYRGSYIHTTWSESAADLSGLDDAGFELNLDGALVKSFDVSGRLAGSAAAIYISNNALVKKINIMQGASLAGDIVSKWDPSDTRVQYSGNKTDLVTELGFGFLANPDGSASQTPDPAFQLSYTGNILGAKSILMAVAAGRLTFNGQADILGVGVGKDATLGGNAIYNLNEYTDNGDSVGGTFSNEGTLAPGNSIGSITINGHYVQSNTGRLAMEFDASGRTDALHVSGTAHLDGALTLAPVRDYYSAPVNFSLTNMVQVTGTMTVQSGFGTAPDLSVTSPTLNMALAVNDNGSNTSYSLTSSRQANAYSRYATNGEDRDVARAIDAWAGQARGDARDLVAALDFSAVDGSGLRQAYPQLGPGLYARSGEASLSALRGVSSTLLFSRTPGSGQTNGSGSESGSRLAERANENGAQHFFLTPLGGYGQSDGNQNGWNNAYGGALAGWERDSFLPSGKLSLGAHTAFLHRVSRFSGSGTNKATSEGFFLGAHGRYELAALPGSYLFGLARLGVESVDQKRSVDFNGYNRTAEANWLSPNASLLLGGGRDFQLGQFSLGPVAWLDYSLSWRPGVTEHGSGRGGGSAINLELERQTSQSLRTSLGARFSASIPTEEHALSASLTATWNHEYLNDYGTARAHFAEMGGPSFSSTADVRDRDTASLALALSGTLSDSAQVSLSGGVDLGRHSTGAWGGLRLDWRF